MKKIFTIIVITLCVVTTSQAQFNYSNQWSLSMNGGITAYQGFGVGIGAEKVFKLSMSSLQIHINYDRNPITIAEEQLHSTFITGDIMYAFSFDKIIKSKVFHLNMGIGATVGYEILPEPTAHTIIVNDRGGLRYGLSAKLQPEFKVNKDIGIYIEPKYTFLFNAITKNQLLFSFGLKYYIR